METSIKDVVIIGGGVSGMTTALYALREGLSVAIIEKGMYGGQLQSTERIDNYSGVPMVSGADLSDTLYEQVSEYPCEWVFDEVVAMDKKGHLFLVQTTDETILSRTVVVAMGVDRRKLGIKGEEAYQGKGVAYCGICDGAFFIDKRVIVVGGGNSAMEEALYLTKFARHVTIMQRFSHLEGQQVLIDEVRNHPKIEVLFNTQVTEILGNDKEVNVVIIEKDGYTEAFITDGVFVSIGLEPRTAILQPLGITDTDGYIVTNENMETSVDGLFAIGDVRKKVIRQIATAVGDGATAGVMVGRYLKK